MKTSVGLMPGKRFWSELAWSEKSLCRPSVPEMTKSNQNDEESLRGSLYYLSPLPAFPFVTCTHYPVVNLPPLLLIC